MEIHIGNRIAEVELLGKEGNIVKLTIDGKEYEVDVVMAENGSCSILHEGKSYNAELVRSHNGKSYKVNTLFSSYNVDIIDTKTKYLSLKKSEEGRQDSKIVSPMPGKVVAIPVQEGDKMKAGDTVIVIEAMKMQSNYKVNSDCTIKKILVKEGDTVNNGQELVLLDLLEVTKD